MKSTECPTSSNISIITRQNLDEFGLKGIRFVSSCLRLCVCTVNGEIASRNYFIAIECERSRRALQNIRYKWASWSMWLNRLCKWGMNYILISTNRKQLKSIKAWTKTLNLQLLNYNYRLNRWRKRWCGSRGWCLCVYSRGISSDKHVHTEGPFEIRRNMQP